MDKTPRWFVALMVVCAVMAVGLLAVALWAVISVVNHFTA